MLSVSVIIVVDHGLLRLLFLLLLLLLLFTLQAVVKAKIKLQAGKKKFGWLLISALRPLCNVDFFSFDHANFFQHGFLSLLKMFFSFLSGGGGGGGERNH